jgi:hypothetical protein
MKRKMREASAFAGEGKVRCHHSIDESDPIDTGLDRMRTVPIEGCVVPEGLKQTRLDASPKEENR